MRTTKSLTISLPPAMLRDMEKAAKRENRTLSELVRENFRRSQELARLDVYQLIRQLAPPPAELQAIREDARRKGVDQLSEAEIDREVRAVRRQHDGKRAVNAAANDPGGHRHQRGGVCQPGRCRPFGRYFSSGRQPENDPDVHLPRRSGGVRRGVETAPPQARPRQNCRRCCLDPQRCPDGSSHSHLANLPARFRQSLLRMRGSCPGRLPDHRQHSRLRPGPRRHESHHPPRFRGA